MADQTIARRYAVAILQLARESDAVESVRDDLHALRDTICGAEGIDAFFVSPIVERADKQRVLSDAFSGKIGDIALHTLLLLVRKRRERLLAQIVAQYDASAMEARGTEPLTITSARELSAQEQRAMVVRLEAVYGKRFDVTQRVDPQLIGGVRVSMGDRRVDGSVAARLEELTRTILSTQ